jgi:hypothetical protein
MDPFDEGLEEPACETGEASDLEKYREGLSALLNVAWTQRFSKATGELTIETDYAVCAFDKDGRFKRVRPQPAARDFTAF